MSQISLRRPILVSLLLIPVLMLPASAFAQDATVTGTITDATGGVLPGVTITATHEATGNTFVAVTDQSGALPSAGSDRHATA